VFLFELQQKKREAIVLWGFSKLISVEKCSIHWF